MVLSLQPIFFPFDYTPSLTEKPGWHQFPKTRFPCESENLQESGKTQVTLSKCLQQPFSFTHPQSHKTTPTALLLSDKVLPTGQEAGEGSSRGRRKAVLR